MTAEINPELAGALARYLESGMSRRADRAAAALAALRPYERRVVREAAVMGYVLGHRAGRIDGIQLRGQSEIESDWPKDSAVLQSVLEHCDSTSDLYPFLGAACDGKRRRVARLWPGETR